MTKAKHVFIDGSHLLMTQRRINEARRLESKRALDIDYKGMLNRVIGDGELGNRSTLFLSHPPFNRNSYMSDSDAEVFEELGIPIRRFPLRERQLDCYECGHEFKVYHEKPVDAAIITAMFIAAVAATDKEELILVSGDGDFHAAAEEISSEEGLNVPLSVYGFERSTSKKFRENPRFAFQDLAIHLVDRPRRTSRPRTRRRERAWPRAKM